MNIKGYEIEFIEDIHCYLVDGVIVQSVTSLLKKKFGKKYEGISDRVLRNASEKGTLMHRAIELYEKQGVEDDSKELKNYKFLKRLHKFECIGNEIPLIIFDGDTPVACGTTDLLLKQDNLIGLGDLKRTATFDKEYLAYQLNLYRIGYQQCYGTEISFLKGIHLREDTRKVVDLPINEDMAMQFLKEVQKDDLLL